MVLLLRLRLRLILRPGPVSWGLRAPGLAASLAVPALLLRLAGAVTPI